jgi:polyhydroxyalkanoate synthesis repressor PhaR
MQFFAAKLQRFLAAALCLFLILIQTDEPARAKRGFSRQNPWRDQDKPALGSTMTSMQRGSVMAKENKPITIKKYANRRLYNTGTSAYITLEDLAAMVKKGDDFVVFDAKSGDDITRSVLTQIIFEQEGKDGQSLMPINFLRQLIRFYGDSMQMLVPSYLEFTIGKLTSEQAKFRDTVAKNFGGPLTAPLFGSME